MRLRLEKHITFCGQPARVACDGNCAKAWGQNRRPRIELSSNVDDYAWLADGELGLAPIDPGTYEGDQTKPALVTGPDDLNRWCVGECERCVMSLPGNIHEPLALRDFSHRVYNLPRRRTA